MSEKERQRSLVEIMNDVLSTVRNYYDSEYVYYIEKEYDDVELSMSGVQKMYRGSVTRLKCWRRNSSLSG